MGRINLRAPGPIALILVCFFASAVIRLGSNGVAIAEVVMAPETEAVPQVSPVVLAPDVGSLLESIRNRQEQLSRQEQEIAARQQVLNDAEARIVVQLAKLQQAEQNLAQTLAIADSAAENDLKQLTEVYEKMKPKSAAEIFATMDISFAAGFLSRMRPESAAGILSEMPPNAAYSISVVMAGKNARAPTE